MIEFFKSYGTLILAILSFTQFWVIALWKKYISKGRMNIYETGNIEIGYNTLGPTISLNGTLRAFNKDTFINSIDLLVIREKDKAQHNFKWFAFRPPKIDLAGTQPIAIEIPSSFLVSPNLPYRYNIVFNDNELLEEIRLFINNYYSEWYRVVEKLKTFWVPSTGVKPPNEVNKEIEDFKKSKIYIDTYNCLYNKCYWEYGNYLLKIKVQISKPDLIVTKTYPFVINEYDSKNLKLNVIIILNEPFCSYLRIKNYNYYNAFSTYKIIENKP